jgi:NADH:ubiquinone oxidoreductase subunit K
MTLERLLILSAILFSIGLYGALTKRNAVTVLMAIEIMFNAVNVALVAVSRYVAPHSLRSDPLLPAEEVLQTVLTGQVFAIFIIAVSAAEIALGLAIVIAIYRSRESIDVSELNLLNR